MNCSRPQDPEWVTFRRRLLDRLDRIDASRFVYIDASRVVHICPVCRAHDGWLLVRFVGRTPTAEIKCSMGCPAEELVRALGLENPQ